VKIAPLVSELRWLESRPLKKNIYSPLGAPWRILMTHTYLLIAGLPSSPSPTERTSSHPRKIIDADCTNSYVLNSGVTEPNIAKFL